MRSVIRRSKRAGFSVALPREARGRECEIRHSVSFSEEKNQEMLNLAGVELRPGSSYYHTAEAHPPPPPSPVMMDEGKRRADERTEGKVECSVVEIA